ncbi:hypothetical protein FIBSPDRAFT_968378 [Athelia psychrophila]|uniref:Uncharacterized protein n=1 Tax=Athelia psychrophila TaxID=1759441 RepID=A0A167UPH0_9AGAM|nr:hypothetical protein FIBSPDRAFT_968378 [Fibularhizoctonia sp. CBS 109695]
MSFPTASGCIVFASNIRTPASSSRRSQLSNDYATATFKVLNVYAGWSNVTVSRIDSECDSIPARIPFSATMLVALE